MTTIDVGEQTRLYQAVLEEARAAPEDEELQLEVEQQRRAMELAWLHSTVRG